MDSFWTIIGFLRGRLGEIVAGVIAGAVLLVLAAAAGRLLWLLRGSFHRPTVIFVSVGGTCRDPMAKAILQRIAAQRGRSIWVYARGVSVGHSKTAATAARIVVRERTGRDLLKHHRTKRLDDRDSRTADLILTMTLNQAKEVIKLFPAAAGKVHVLGAFLGTDEEFENPYRKPDEVDPEALQRYRASYDQLEQSLIAGSKRIFEALGVA